MRRRAAALTLLTFLLLPLLDGCWSRQELGQVDLVLALGIDRAPGGYRLSAQVVVSPQPGISGGGGGGGGGDSGGGGGRVLTVTQTEDTPAFSLHHMRTQLPTGPSWTHVELIVVGEALARSGLAPALDFMTRAIRIRDDAWLVVARGRAEAVLRARPTGNDLPARGLHRTLEQSVGQSMVPRESSVMHFLALLDDTGIDATAPLVLINTQGQLQIRGLAVFRGDRMVGELDHEATHGFNLVRGGSAHGALAFRCGPAAGRADSFLTITRRRSSVRPAWGAGPPEVHVDVRLRGTLDDRTCLQPLSDPAAVAAAEAQAAAAARRDIVAAVATGRRLGADIFAFGRELWRHWPDRWLRLPRVSRGYLPRLHLQVTTAVHFDNTGETVDPVPGGATP